MRLLEKNIRARDVVTRKSLENAARVVACTGGSTNGGLHLPAIAHEAGIEFTLQDVCDIFRDTPYFVDLKPGGKYVAKDLFEAGGVPVVLKELLRAGLLHGDCMTASGRTIGEELDDIRGEADGRVIFPVDTPISATGGVVGLKGNLAPEGAIVKVAGMSEAEQVFTGPARVFECEEDAFDAVQKRAYEEGEVIVIRNEGPRRRPRHARDAGDHRGALRPGHGQEGGADHRRPLLRRHPRLLRRPCRARRRRSAGRSRSSRDGDMITLDAIRGEISVALTDAELAAAARGLDRARGRRSTARARSGNTPSWSGRPGSARSPTPAREARSTSMPTSERAARGARSPSAGLALAGCDPTTTGPAARRRAPQVNVAGQAVTIAGAAGLLHRRAQHHASTPPAPSC